LANILIRNVDEALRAQLKARARAHRRSVEEEARETLRTACARDAATEQPASLLKIAQCIFGSARGVDLELGSRDNDASRKPPDFTGSEYGR
jgi:plasmid stability protein